MRASRATQVSVAHGVGRELVHLAFDDCSSLAVSEDVLDESQGTALDFLHQPVRGLQRSSGLCRWLHHYDWRQCYTTSAGRPPIAVIPPAGKRVRLQG